MLVTVSDRKLVVPCSNPNGCPTDADGNLPLDHYMADVVSATDYYPGGMSMPERKFSSDSYRYGFNGKEKDKDMQDQTVYDYGFRIYNPALGRFLSVDPLSAEYPWYTPYQFAGNKPIIAIDVDGLEDKIVITEKFIEESRKAVSANDAQVKYAIQNGHRIIMRITYATGPDNSDSRDIVFNEGTTSSDVGFIDFSTNGINRQWTFHYQPPPAQTRITEIPPPSASEPPIGIIEVQLKEQPPFKGRRVSTPPGTEQKRQNPPPKKNQPPKASPPKAKPPVAIAVPPPPQPPPPTPDPNNMCYHCFNGSDEPHFKRGVSDIVKWLNTNKNYKLKITADGGSSTLIKDDWDDRPYGSSTTYKRNTDNMFKRLVDAVNAAGGDGSRIVPQRGKADGTNLKYQAIQ